MTKMNDINMNETYGEEREIDERRREIGCEGRVPRIVCVCV